MKNVKALNIKNMKETLVNYSGEQSELEKVWESFYSMVCLGFIDRETWKKFFDQCKGWYITEDQSEVRDMEHDDALVWRYTSESFYTA